MFTSLSWREHTLFTRVMKEKNPIALLINDIHVSKDNIAEFQLNWDEALEVCDKYGIADIIVGGDMWHSRSSQSLDVLMAVRNAIIKATSNEINLTIAEGNHCKVDQESLLGYSHLFSEYPNVYVVDDYTIMDISDNVVLYVMSYFPENGSFAERIKAISADLDKNKTNILYAHEGIRGGLATPSDDELPANLFSNFDTTLVGHYHNRKKIAGTNIEYIGSSRQNNFGEDEEKGYTILYDDGSYEFVKNNANTRYMVIDVELADMDDKFFSRLQEIKKEGRYKVKVRISCSTKESQTVDKQKCIENGAAKLEFVTEQTQIQLTEAQDISKKYDKSGIKQEYVNFCNDRAISNVELGLDYLNKIQ